MIPHAPGLQLGPLYPRAALVVTFEVASAYLLAEWAVIAATAVARPETLPQEFSGLTPELRRDTAAAVAFGLSLLCFGCAALLTHRASASHHQRAGGGSTGGSGAGRSERSLALVRRLAVGAVVYGTASWLYISANSLAHPETLLLPLTHLAGHPREDTYGLLCFIVSFLGMLTFQLTSLRGERDHRASPRATEAEYP